MSQPHARVVGGHQDCGVIFKFHLPEVNIDIENFQFLLSFREVAIESVHVAHEGHLSLTPQARHQVDLCTQGRKARAVGLDLTGNELCLQENRYLLSG